MDRQRRLRDVVAEMPIEVREAGTVEWLPATVVAVLTHGLCTIRADVEKFRRPRNYPPNFVRRRVFDDPKG
jgi:hypothetical protein